MKVKNEFQKKKQIKKLLSMIEQRLLDMQTLNGGWIMSNKMFRLMLKEHPQFNVELDMLNERKEKLMFTLRNL